MNIVIFVGPTLPECEVKEILPDALIMEPAEQGDIDFARYQLGADIVALIDGKHTLCLPPWHKEILSILNDGARFIGSSSLGALRAVECEDFGAEPIGEIAEMYRSHRLVADDEVCLIHASRESNYKKLSVPMVNIRATLQACPIQQSLKNDIIDCALGLYYPDREWGHIFDTCEISEEDRATIEANEVDLKAADALALCYYIKKTQDSIREKHSSVAKRQIRNAGNGYGFVFDHNDRKVIHGGKIMRQHDIALSCGTYDKMNARNRALAVEFCTMLGLLPKEKINTVTEALADDLSSDERASLCAEETALARAGEWMSSRVYGNHDVSVILDYLRISGKYEITKQEVKTNGN